MIRKFLHKTRLEKQLIIKALFLSFFVRMVIILFPPRKWNAIFKLVTFRSNKIYNNEILKSIKSAVKMVSKVTPWRCMCLEQAFVCRVMCELFGYHTNLYLSVNNINQKIIKAHAWIENNTTSFNKKKYNIKEYQFILSQK